MTPVERKHFTGLSALCRRLALLESDFRLARAQIDYIYVEKTKYDPRRNKSRDLCYPPRESILFTVQERIKDHILRDLPLLPEVRGYRENSHNINTAARVCGFPQLGIVDIHKFHPSITRRHVSMALREHGLSPSWSRLIAKIVTYKNQVPQGAPTSNHIANLVMDSLLRRFIACFVKSVHIAFCNYGDDVAFFGNNAAAVRACVAKARKTFAQLGFTTNAKCRECEHRGGKRTFIGCATGREVPDLPRIKFLAFRKELRTLLQSERMRCAARPLTTRKDLDSLRHRIWYVQRMNSKKARKLKELFYKLCAARRVTPSVKTRISKERTASQA